MPASHQSLFATLPFVQKRSRAKSTTGRYCSDAERGTELPAAGTQVQHNHVNKLLSLPNRQRGARCAREESLGGPVVQ